MANKAMRLGSKFASRGSKSTADAPKVASANKAMQENDYMAEEDARTIARAHAIKADPERVARAGKAAAKMADEKSAELRGLRHIARKAQ